jgi:hypothetical protein
VHGPGAPAAADYHQQYEQGEFLEALRATRLRQARRWVELVRRHVPEARRLLDFGCGGGWFLEVAAASGFDTLAGADSSPLAVANARSMGFEALLVPAERPEDLALESLSFRPEVVTLLDVVEHLAPTRARDLLGTILDRCAPELRLVVVKVPVSSGLLHRLASALAAAGRTGPLEQLYQVGTSPPHLGYFSRHSLERFLVEAGLRPVAWQRDRDMEPESFRDPVAALRSLPPWLATAAGYAVAHAATALHMEDALVCLAVPERPGGAARAPSPRQHRENLV